MKKHSVLIAILALGLASLACQTVMGGGNSNAPEPFPNDGGETEPFMPVIPTIEIEGGDNGGDGGITIGRESEFPMPEGAFNVMNISGVLNFQVKMPLDEAMKFYMDTFTKSGYTERTILTTTTDTVFSMVFDGHKSGKAIVIQGVDLGDGSVNINISLQDL